MRKTHNILGKLFYFFIIFTIIFSCFNFVMAAEGDYPTEEFYELEIDETSNENNSSETETQTTTEKEPVESLYIMQNDVNIDYFVAGNAFIMGKHVTIDESVQGNVFILADEVTITKNSYIYEEAFILANKVTLSGTVANMYCSCNTFNLTSTGYVIRDLSCSGKTITLDGFVNRNAYISGSELNIADEKVVVKENLEYSLPKTMTFPENAVGNNITKKSSIKLLEDLKDLAKSLVSLIIILIVVFLFKGFVHDLVDYLQNDKGKIILYGLLGLVCIPIISLIFLITVIGLPICILLMSAYIFAITIANAIVGLAIGSYICSKTNKEKNDPTLMKIILISLLVVLGILLISNIPYIGALVSFVKIVLCFGLLLQPLLKKKNK